jgi:RNA polymerase sigma-70 factor (ECF subfamily)
MRPFSSTPETFKLIPECIAAARSGSNAARGQLLEACRPYLLTVAYAHMSPRLHAKTTPADLVQQTFVEALQSFHDFHGDTELSLVHWLRRILVNNVANAERALHTRKRLVTLEIELERCSPEKLIAPGKTGSSDFRGQERRAIIHAALAELRAVDQDVIRLCFFERLPYEEIGRRMGLTADAVRKSRVLALYHLAKFLEKNYRFFE